MTYHKSLDDTSTKTYKSYTCKISGNVRKREFLNEQLDIIQDLSWFVFTLGTKYSKTWWVDQKKLYHHCRFFFPEVHAKVLQNFISFYQPKGKRRLPKYKIIQPAIFIDQCNHLVFKINNSNKLTNYWLRFRKTNFPLFGKNILKKIEDPSKIKLVQIFRKNKELYCKFSYLKEVNFSNNSNNIIGLDVNTKQVSLSNNSIYKMTQRFHRATEAGKKNNQKKRLFRNYQKDFLHKMTTKISRDLHSQNVEVLVLEDLKNIRKSSSRKLGTSKGKKTNFVFNNNFPFSMFQEFLSYKCLSLGINVKKIQPQYTSKSCSRCGSVNTSRPTQSIFVCHDCIFQLNADLNASRNIRTKYILSNELPVNPAQIGTLKPIEAITL